MRRANLYVFNYNLRGNVAWLKKRLQSVAKHECITLACQSLGCQIFVFLMLYLYNDVGDQFVVNVMLPSCCSLSCYTRNTTASLSCWYNIRRIWFVFSWLADQMIIVILIYRLFVAGESCLILLFQIKFIIRMFIFVAHWASNYNVQIRIDYPYSYEFWCQTIWLI